MKIWASAQLKAYPNIEVCQAVIVRMMGTVEGFALQLLEKAEQDGWIEWQDKGDEQRRVIEGLQMMI